MYFIIVYSSLSFLFRIFAALQVPISNSAHILHTVFPDFEAPATITKFPFMRKASDICFYCPFKPCHAFLTESKLVMQNNVPYSQIILIWPDYDTFRLIPWFYSDWFRLIPNDSENTEFQRFKTIIFALTRFFALTLHQLSARSEPQTKEP